MMDAYCSPFHDWHRAAAVRTMPAELWLIDAPGAWMAEQPDGVLSHPALRDAPRERIAAGLLIAHLSFTVALENTLIAMVARDIAARALDARYDDRVVADALRVQCDEAYHALLAQELMAHVSASTRVARPRRRHGFLEHVERLVAALPDVNAAQVRFCAAVVAETLITHTLRDDWRDDALRPDVHTFLHQHYLDEARHSAYFSRLLKIVWPQWPAEAHAALRPLWLDLIDAFLFADAGIVRDVLADACVAPREIERVMATCASPDAIRTRREQSTRQTLHALRRAGALDMADVARVADAEDA
jgi:hypothetical protein